MYEGVKFEDDESSQSSIATYSQSVKKTRDKDWIFIFDCVCDSKQEAVDALLKKKLWSEMKTVFSKRSKTSKCNYRCNQVTYRDKNQFTAAVYILLEADFSKASIYLTLIGHSHNKNSKNKNSYFKNQRHN